MNLTNPITITPPSIQRPDGTLRTFNPIVLKELDVTIIDNAKRKSVIAQIRPCPKPLVLWEGHSYDVAGDYTQAQAESRILELLGDDQQKALEDLFSHSVPPLPTPNKK